jgi:hypothetical protein
LQIEQWPSVTQTCRVRFVPLHRSALTTTQHCNRGRLSGKPEKLSSCRHLLQRLDPGVNSQPLENNPLVVYCERLVILQEGLAGTFA